MKVFWTSIEYKYLKGANNFGRLKGGFVYAFVKSIDVRDALNKFEKEIESLKIGIINVEFISPYEDIPWGTEEEKRKYDNLAKQASKSEEVICDDFYAYEDE